MKFLSSDYIIVGGRSKGRGHAQIFNISQNTDDYPLDIEVVPNVSLKSSNLPLIIPENLQKIELCNVTGKNQLVFSTLNSSTKLSCVDVLKDADDVFFGNHITPLTQSTLDSHDEISCLRWDKESRLAVATENGDVCLENLVEEKEISRFSADLCGVNDVEFVEGGFLTAGSSKKSQLKYWDQRINPSSPAIEFKHPTRDSFHSSYTTLCVNEINQKLLCGTNFGEIVEWDRRKPISPWCNHGRLHTGRVTGLAALGVQSFVSSSIDGTVKHKRSNDLHSDDRDGDIVVDYGPMTSLASRNGSSHEGITVIAVSSLGGLWLKHYPY